MASRRSEPARCGPVPSNPHPPGCENQTARPADGDSGAITWAATSRGTPEVHEGSASLRTVALLANSGSEGGSVTAPAYEGARYSVPASTRFAFDPSHAPRSELLGARFAEGCDVSLHVLTARSTSSYSPSPTATKSRSPAGGGGGRDNQRKQRRDDAPSRRPAGTRQTPVFLSTRVAETGVLAPSRGLLAAVRAWRCRDWWCPPRRVRDPVGIEGACSACHPRAMRGNSRRPAGRNAGDAVQVTTQAPQSAYT